MDLFNDTSKDTRVPLPETVFHLGLDKKTIWGRKMMVTPA
jgi:hypothetical protein